MANTIRKRFSYAELGEMSDADLQFLFKNLKGSINERRKNRRSTRDLEVECCYVQKELEDRTKWSGSSLKVKRPSRRPLFNSKS